MDTVTILLMDWGSDLFGSDAKVSNGELSGGENWVCDDGKVVVGCEDEAIWDCGGGTGCCK